MAGDETSPQSLEKKGSQAPTKNSSSGELTLTPQKKHAIHLLLLVSRSVRTAFQPKSYIFGIKPLTLMSPGGLAVDRIDR